MTESTTKQNPTIAGLKVMRDLQDILNKQLKGATDPREFYLQRVATAVRNAYGNDLSDWQVLNVCAALQELNECDKCTGYPCHKSATRGTGRGFKPNNSSR